MNFQIGDRTVRTRSVDRSEIHRLPVNALIIGYDPSDGEYNLYLSRGSSYKMIKLLEYGRNAIQNGIDGQRTILHKWQKEVEVEVETDTIPGYYRTYMVI